MAIEENLISEDVRPLTLPSQGSSLHVVRRLRRTFLSICRCGDILFSPYRLTTDQYALMRAVQRNPGIRQTDMTDQIFAEPNTITAMVKLLEKRGILRRKICPVDGRVRLLYLTAHGNTVLQRLSEDWTPMRHVLRDCFSGQAGQQALKILDEVFQKMQSEREKLLEKSSLLFTAESNPSSNSERSAPKKLRNVIKRSRRTIQS